MPGDMERELSMTIGGAVVVEDGKIDDPIKVSKLTAIK